MCYNLSCSAGVAHPVERHLAKVEVASSSLVTRSIKETVTERWLFFFYPVGKNNMQSIKKAKSRQLAAFSVIS